jgi:hypothetical protein
MIIHTIAEQDRRRVRSFDRKTDFVARYVLCFQRTLREVERSDMEARLARLMIGPYVLTVDDIYFLEDVDAVQAIFCLPARLAAA